MNENFNQNRKNELKKQLDNYYKLLSDYENNLMLETDPRKKMRNEKERFYMVYSG